MPLSAAGSMRPSHLLAARITGLPAAVQRLGDDLVAGGDAGARVDHEQEGIGFGDGGQGLAGHAGAEAFAAHRHLRNPAVSIRRSARP